MKGVSEIIVVILILMIAISLSSFGYITFTSLFSSMKTSAENSMNNTVSSMLSQMSIESIVRGTGGADTKVYIRNIGKVTLSNFSAYDDDNYVKLTDTTVTIPPGQVGSINISGSLNPAVNAGSLIKVTTGQGTIAMQTAT